MQKNSSKSGGSNKITAFLKRNIYYVLLVLCVLAIGTMITVAAVVNNNGGETPPVIKPDDGNNGGGSDLPIVKEFIITMPVTGDVIAPFNPNAIYNGKAHPHNAIDIKAAAGTKVVSPFDGVVTKLDKTANYGLYGMTLTIDHQNGYVSVIRMLDNVNVTLNQTIKAGEVIGEVVSKDKAVFEIAMGQEHVHYELFKDGKAIDPMQFMSDGNK